MSDFLHFLNTANAEALTTLSGISPSLAEGLIAARPYDSVEGCLKVRGMGKNLLARAQASFENAEQENEPEERSLIPVEQQEMEPALVEEHEPMEESDPIETRPSFGDRLGQAVLWFFRSLVRLILIVLVIGGIGAIIYYGTPFLYEKFVTPVERNAIRVNQLESDISALETQLTEINNQLTLVNSRLEETNNRIDEIEGSIQAHTASIATLEEMQDALEIQLAEGSDKTLLALKNEITMTRVLDLLARARLYLAQSNFGLAKEDVLSAHDLLAELQEDTNDEILMQAVDRLELALNNLPGFPVVASGDLEIAWQILITGESAPTPTPESTPEATTTPTATPDTTPSLTPTP